MAWRHQASSYQLNFLLGLINSRPAAKLNNSPAVAFGWPPSGQNFELPHGYALCGNFLSQFAAGFGLAVKRPRDGCGAAHVCEKQNFYLKIATIVGDPQHVPYANLARCLSGLAVGVNPAEFASSRRQG